MTKGKTVIAVVFANTVNHRLVNNYLSELGYELSEYPCKDPQNADLFILDVPSACRFGREVLGFKRIAGVFLPVLIALGPKNPIAPWLEAGYDDTLRQPCTKAELRCKVAILIQLRQQSQVLSHRQEAKYQAVFKATSAATILVDKDATILMANKECLCVTGY